MIFCSKSIWICVLFTVMGILVPVAFPNYLDITDVNVLEISKCPACFGVTLCPQFLTGKILLEPWSLVSSTLLLNSKNVYYADLEGEKVVLKKLGHDHELENLDTQILKLSKPESSPFRKHISFAIRQLSNQYLVQEFIPDAQGSDGKTIHHLKMSDAALMLRNEGRTGSDILVCPSQRKLNMIENQFVKKNSGVNRLTALYNIMTLLILNSEPLVFQAFRAEDGWPFPHYIGACGRFVVEEYVGPSLSDWLPSASWIDKMNAALLLLLMAEQLTVGKSGFAMYWTDWSLFNIAVDQQHRLKIVDAENIILVDLQKILRDRPKDYDVPYASDNGGCDDFKSDPDCQSYVEQEFCRRLYHDHNYFSACRLLFHPADHFGLLNGLPNYVVEQFPSLAKHQADCYSSNPQLNRTEAAQNLISIYSVIINR